jgi:hypothetical protein
MRRHNERSFEECLEFSEMWRSEIAGLPVRACPRDDRGSVGPADLIADLVRIAHDRRRLGSDVAASFKGVAAAVGISPEGLAEAVRAALETERAA